MDPLTLTIVLSLFNPYINITSQKFFSTPFHLLFIILCSEPPCGSTPVLPGYLLLRHSYTWDKTSIFWSCQFPLCHTPIRPISAFQDQISIFIVGCVTTNGGVNGRGWLLEEEEERLQKRERERERSLAQSPREVVGRLLMVEMVVVRVLVVEGHGGERERKERKWRWQQKKMGNWFFGNFGPDFLLPQAMKSTPIYRGYKMDISSLLMPNLGPWFILVGSQPLTQSSYHGLSVLLLIKDGWVGHFGAVPQPLRRQSIKTDHTPSQMSGDQFHASFVQFGGEMKHKIPRKGEL